MAKKKVIVAVCFGLLDVLFARNTFAASLFISPNSGTYSTGNTFTVGVYVSSPDVAMNAAQGTITFPSDRLSALSLSKTNSIMTIWVQDPSFSNHEGTINFGGVSVSPGFQGSSGKILAITFQAKNVGTAALSFLSGSVLANDGKGTNILTDMQGANFSVAKSPAGTSQTSGSETTITTAPSVPSVISIPPVNDGAWYNLNSIEFNWNMPSGADRMRYALASSSDYGFPTTTQEVASQTTYDLSQLTDGVWYFLLSIGRGEAWSPPAVKTLHLDRTPPEPFSITRVDNDLASARPVFDWTTTDKTSGLAFYRVKIGNGDWFDPEGIREESSYVLPPQSPEDARTLTVRAYDNAGNVREVTAVFLVVPQSGWQAWCYQLVQFLKAWGWFLVSLALMLAFGAYLFIGHFIFWRRRLKRELRDFENELRRDIDRLEANREVSKEKRRQVEKETKLLEKDVEEEIKKIEEL